MEKYITPSPTSCTSQSENDCTIQALVNCTDYDYALAHKVCTRAGYTPEGGLYTHLIGDMLTGHGFKPYAIEQGLTVGEFIEQNQPGTFYCVMICGENEHHAFCVKNGQYLDCWKVNAKAKMHSVFMLKSECDYY